MKIGVIVAQTFGSCGENAPEPLRARHIIFKFWQMFETFVQRQQGVRQKFKVLAVQRIRFFHGVRFVSGG